MWGTLDGRVMRMMRMTHLTQQLGGDGSTADTEKSRNGDIYRWCVPPLFTSTFKQNALHLLLPPPSYLPPPLPPPPLPPLTRFASSDTSMSIYVEQTENFRLVDAPLLAIRRYSRWSLSLLSKTARFPFQDTGKLLYYCEVSTTADELSFPPSRSRR